MTTFDPTNLAPNDRAYTYVWIGGEGQDPLPFTVVRVNPRTVTARLDSNVILRVKHEDIVGRWTDS